MKSRTETDNPGERLSDRLKMRQAVGPLNWDDIPSEAQLDVDSEHLEGLRRRITTASQAMLATLREQMGLDPLQVVLIQHFDIQTGGIKMSARAIQDPMALATLRGKVVEVGNLEGDPGMCVELDDKAGMLTMLGLTEDQARAIAPYYAGRIEIIVRALPEAPEHIHRLQQAV